ncbi:MAG: hypothetical protein E6J10_12505 [Chloroflexi bacterium]|nr:MAG: hypothetical protein E6J10_12505 [Chloroflexota bacterium]
MGIVAIGDIIEEDRRIVLGGISASAREGTLGAADVFFRLGECLAGCSPARRVRPPAGAYY